MASLCGMLLLLVAVFLLGISSSSSRAVSHQEDQISAVLDVKAVLESINLQHQHPSVIAIAAHEDHDQDAAAELPRLVHRSSLHPPTKNSHHEIVKQRLRRDEARVQSIGQRLSMALNDVKQSDLQSTLANPSASEARAGGSSGSPITSGLTFGSGEYFVRLGVGTPSKQMFLVMDTGSDVPWIQCSPCKSCYKQYDGVFNPTESSTFRNISCSSQQCNQLDVKACGSSGNNCMYQVAYGDGSFTVGDLVSDTFSIRKSQSGGNFVFGCGHDNEGLFIGAAGLLGLGAGKLSFPSQLTGASHSRKFSYCLVSRDNGVKASSALLFGDSAFPSGTSFAYTQLLKNPRLETFYYAGLSGISVGGNLLSIPSTTFRLSSSTGRGGVILDSGTSVTRLPTAAYTAMRDAFRSRTQKLPKAAEFSLFDTCYDLSSLTSVTIPTVAFHFEGAASIQLPPANYMVAVDDAGTFCFAFAKTSLDLSIIGNIQQQTMRVAIDLDSSRIGFAPKQCT